MWGAPYHRILKIRRGVRSWKPSEAKTTSASDIRSGC